MKRIFLFLATNFAVMLLISVIFKLFGIEGVLAQNGVDLDLRGVLVFSLIVGFAGSIISLLMSKHLAKSSMGVYVIEQPSNPTERWLVETVYRLADQAGVGRPEVGIFDSPQPNAFATGANRDNALVAVSSGLLQHMSKDEVEAVLGHEISHVANGDMITMTLMQGVVNTFVMFFATVIGHVVDRVVFKNEEGHGPAYYITSLIAQALLTLLATMLVMWFSRWREFHADAGGAELAGREKMIAALRRLQQASEPEDLPDQMAAFGISGRATRGFKELFLSHPPLEDRIEALQQMR